MRGSPLTHPSFSAPQGTVTRQGDPIDKGVRGVTAASSACRSRIDTGHNGVVKAPDKDGGRAVRGAAVATTIGVVLVPIIQDYCHILDKVA